MMDDEVAGPKLGIELLGDFRLTYGGDPVSEVDSPRLQSLLAYLLLHRDAPQSRHRLAFLFWPDSPEDQALTNLRNLLYRLRHSLPDVDRFLQADRNTLLWNPEAPFELDVAQFERALERAERALDREHPDRHAAREALEQAAGVYQGDLLPSCYDDWIVPVRDRLWQAFARGMEKLTGLLEEQQAYGAGVEYAQKLLRHDPLREASYRRLMRLHALRGDRANALRTYHKCASVLERELGLEPSPATKEVYERLLTIEEAPTLQRRSSTAVSPVSPLVGREKAWRQLMGAWRTAAAGRPQAAFISGETGIGKTRLAEELDQWARRQGITTATGRCYASEGALAYAGVVSWLRGLPLPKMDDVWTAEIGRILPELLADRSDLPRPGPLSESWQRQRFFEALARAVLGADQPLLLSLDSVQWCDQRMLEWLHYLLRYDPRARLLVVGTFRPGETGDEDALTSLLHALRQEERLTQIELDPLDRAETGELAANLAGRDLSSNLVDCLYAETEGNPLFIVETVRAGLPDEVRGSPSEGYVCVPRPLPSRMQDALGARINQLSSPARALAELAATIGREFTFPVLSRASDRGEDALVGMLDELWRRRILREQGEIAYDFAHDKLREVIYQGLSGARRRLLHRRVATALEKVHADALGAVAGEIACHYERAGERDEAISYYRQAARTAESLQLEEDADRFLGRAAALTEGTGHGRA